MKTLKILGLVVALGLAAGTQAAPLDCAVNASGDASANARCRGSQFDSSVFSPMRVSIDDVLSFNLWMVDEDKFYSDLSHDGGTGATGRQVSGVWSIDNLRALMAESILAHPSRGDRASAWMYIGYKLEARDLTHHPESMFADPRGEVDFEPAYPDADGAAGAGAQFDNNDGDSAATYDDADGANGRGGELVANNDEVGAGDQADENQGRYEDEIEGEPDSDSTQIPEPSMLALIGIGLPVLFLARRRKTA